MEVEDITTSPPEREPYTMLKTELVRWLQFKAKFDADILFFHVCRFVDITNHKQNNTHFYLTRHCSTIADNLILYRKLLKQLFLYLAVEVHANNSVISQSVWKLFDSTSYVINRVSKTVIILLLSLGSWRTMLINYTN
jgi:hypothetical protein